MAMLFFSCLIQLQIFQRDNLLVTEVVPELEEAVMQLLDLKQHPGSNMEAFVKSYKPDKRQFKSIELQGPCPVVEFNNDQTCLSLIDGTVKYIDKRFENFKQPPLTHFQAFDFSLWPQERENLSSHGHHDISSLLEHFSSLFPTGIQSSIQKEFVSLKAHLKGSQRSMFEVYKELLQRRPPKFKAILELVEIMFVISPSTATCERIFSKMNRIKTSLRSSLSQDALRGLLRIMEHGAPVKEFDPAPGIQVFLTSGPGTRHIRGHVIPETSDVPETTRQNSKELSV